MHYRDCHSISSYRYVSQQLVTFNLKLFFHVVFVNIFLFPEITYVGGYVLVQCDASPASNESAVSLSLNGEILAVNDSRLRVTQFREITTFSILPITLEDDSTFVQCTTTRNGEQYVSRTVEVRVDRSLTQLSKLQDFILSYNYIVLSHIKHCNR